VRTRPAATSAKVRWADTRMAAEAASEAARHAVRDGLRHTRRRTSPARWLHPANGMSPTFRGRAQDSVQSFTLRRVLNHYA